MRTIPLSKGKIALVDDEDYNAVIGYSWHAQDNGKTWYAAAWNPATRKPMYLHRYLMGFPPCKVDHRNRNGLDCTRENLRQATHSHNNANQGKHRENTSSRFKGVYWEAKRQKWVARIDSRYIGRYGDETEAAKAYDGAALQEWGEFACLNFPT